MTFVLVGNKCDMELEYSFSLNVVEKSPMKKDPTLQKKTI